MIDRWRRTLRPFLVALLAALSCLAATGSQPIEARDSGDNSAIAINDEDGSSLFDVAFEIRRVSSGAIDQTNSAVAYASCESCQTVAIAIQIVLVSGTVDTATPTNLAIALNEGCASCQTLALAYQFVFGTGETIGFTGEGNRRLREIGRELTGLSKVGLTNEEIGLRVLELTDEIRDVLATEVVTRGRGHGRGTRGGRGERDERAAPRGPPRTVPEDPAPEDEVAPSQDDVPLPEDSPTEQPEEPTPPAGDPDATAPEPSGGSDPSGESTPGEGSTAPSTP